MFVVVWIITLALGAALLAEASRRLSPWVSVALLVAVPAALTPYWLDGHAPAFSAVKVYSVVVAALYIQSLRLTHLADRPVGRAIAVLVLAVNIVEAIVVDALAGRALSALAGVMVILLQASPKAVRVPHTGARREVIYDVGGWWLAAYTAWNFGFVYGTRPEMAAFGLAHLIAPLVASAGNAGRWPQARALTLSLLMIFRMSTQPPYLVLVPEWNSPLIRSALHVGAFAVALVAAWRTARNAMSTREPRTFLDLILARLRG